MSHDIIINACTRRVRHRARVAHVVVRACVVDRKIGKMSRKKNKLK